MIINSISLKDFECYRGTHEENEFNFLKGINLIIGDNGGGKSKLFNGFYWVLYDQVFNTDERQFVSTKIYKENLISDNAKSLCSIGDKVSAEVTLLVQDSRDVEFRITRIYRSKKTDDRKWEGEATSKLLIDEFKVTRWQSVPSERHQSILDRVIPGHLKPYMWFQGEQVDSLMDFKDKSSLMQAVNLLSDISDYDKIIEITAAGFEKAEKAYNAAAKKLSSNQLESEKLSNKIKNLLRDIKKTEEEKEKNEEDRNIAQTKFDGLFNKIDDAERKTELKYKKDKITEELEQHGSDLSIILGNLNKKLFTDSWVLRSASLVFNEFSDKYDSYYQAHHDKLNINKEVVLKLPINIPQPIHVNKMLSDENCFVCGRDAKKGSKEYNHIKNLLDRNEEAPTFQFENDCSSLFQKLYNNSLSYGQLIKNIDNNIGKEFDKLQEISSIISEKRENLKYINEQFEELIDDDRSEDIVKEFKTHQRKIETATEFIAQNEKILESLRSDLSTAKTKHDRLVGGDVDVKIISARDIFYDLQRIAISTKEDVFTGLVNSLEASANEIFQQMTSENSSITGKLKLRRLSQDSCIPEIVDKDGFIMSGSNDSNIIIVKLSLIMAIITSKPLWSQNYSLISDAPTSKMSKKYSNGFYAALSQNFEQSIVMTYDFLSEDDRSTLRDLNIGNIYKITSNYPHGDREDRSDLSIDIAEVSL